jgi:hypothetical protein
MARSKSDISNSAIRIFLQKVGDFYDEERGFKPFRPTKKQKAELLDYFDGCCAYCGQTMTADNFSQDHLIPMNKEHLGLHAWGNVIPSCKRCNGEKLHAGWREFLATKTRGTTLEMRQGRVESFVEQMGYDPTLKLGKIAGNLYEDVGAVAMTLIDLRFGQAKEAIHQLLGEEL